VLWGYCTALTQDCPYTVGYGILPMTMIKNVSVLKTSFACLCCALVMPFAAADSGTVREHASTHFDMQQWSTPREYQPAIAMEGTTVPGGNETFASLGADSESGVPALYPTIPDLGPLDYSEINQGLLDVLKKLSQGFIDQKIDAALCRPGRDFLPVIAAYQLEKLPMVDQSFFSRPIQSEAGNYAVTYRLRFSPDTERQGTSNLLVRVTASQIKENWYIDEIVFDGKGYAESSRKD